MLAWAHQFCHDYHGARHSEITCIHESSIRFAHLVHPVQLAPIEPSVADTDALPLSCYKDLWATEGISDPDLPI